MPVSFFKHRSCPAVDPEFNLLPQAEGRLPLVFHQRGGPATPRLCSGPPESTCVSDTWSFRGSLGKVRYQSEKGYRGGIEVHGATGPFVYQGRAKDFRTVRETLT